MAGDGCAFFSTGHGTTFHDGGVVVFGGRSNDGHFPHSALLSDVVNNDLQKFTISSGEWTEWKGGSPPGPREAMGMTSLGNSLVAVTGPQQGVAALGTAARRRLSFAPIEQEREGSTCVVATATAEFLFGKSRRRPSSMLCP